MLTSTVVPAGMLPLVNLVLWWWDGLRDVATLANLVLCIVGGEEGRGGGGVNITTDHSCQITYFNHGS